MVDVRDDESPDANAFVTVAAINVPQAVGLGRA